MKKKVTDTKKLIIAFLLLLILSIIADISYKGELKDGYIEREEIGGDEKELILQLDVEGLLENYEYFLTVSPKEPSREDAEEYFKETIAIIEEDFTNLESEVPLKDEYLKGAVDAVWSFQPFGVVEQDGSVNYDKIDGTETILQAQVELSCGEYEEIYEFAFVLKPKALSKKENILREVEKWMESEMELQGSTRVHLPSQIAESTLQWTEKREFVSPKVLCLELVAFLLFKIWSKRKCKEEEEKRLREMERDYPDIVNQLSLLLGAGMTSRQAWNKISIQYKYKRTSGMVREKSVYEAIIRMNRRLMEGENERTVYQKFMEEIPVASYRKLLRLLVASLEKGMGEVSCRLEGERRRAFEQRITLAKKSGEEASTKMLVPLMIMLVLVMGVVILPALLKFQI